MRHQFASGKADGPDTTLVRPSNWNATHKGELFNWTSNGDFELWVGSVATDWVLSGAGASSAKNTSQFRYGVASADLTRGGADAQLYQDVHSMAGAGPAGAWGGITITFGAWVRATVASRARLFIYDGSATTFSSYHSGGSAFEFLTVTVTLGTPTAVRVGLQVDTGSATAQIDGAILCRSVLPTDYAPSGLVPTPPSPAWITPSYSGGNFTANGSMTWTVDSGDVTTYAYKLLDSKTMHLSVVIVTSSVGGTPNSELRVAIPGGFTSAKLMEAVGRASDNGGTSVACVVQAQAGVTYIRVFKDMTGSGNWSAATNTTTVIFSITFELQ